MELEKMELEKLSLTEEDEDDDVTQWTEFIRNFEQTHGNEDILHLLDELERCEFPEIPTHFEVEPPQNENCSYYTAIFWKNFCLRFFTYDTFQNPVRSIYIDTKLHVVDITYNSMDELLRHLLMNEDHYCKKQSNEHEAILE